MVRVESGQANLAERGAWSLVWLAVITGGVNAWGFWWWSPAAAALAPLMVLAGITGMAACWMTSDARGRLLQWSAYLAVSVTVLFPQVAEINTRKFYTTDSAAFDQVATRLLLSGKDPYSVPMSHAVSALLQVPVRLWTDTVTGDHVSHFSYPAGSFLLQLPAMALGSRHMVVDWTDLVCWLVTVTLIFALLPASIRWLAALMALTPIFVGTFASGGTDAMFLPFLVLAVWRWDRFGVGAQAGLARWIGPVALGLACSVKQDPWFCVPFLAAGIFIEARRAGRPAVRLVARYLSTVFAVFALVNIVFVAWQPGAWLHGTLLPFTSGLVADGQGLVSLAIHGVVGGVDLTMLSATAALAIVSGLTAFVLWYSNLKRIWPVLVILPFFLSPRSLSTYLVDLIPVAVMAALSVRSAPPPGSSSRFLAFFARWPALRLAAVGVPCLGTVALCAIAFSGPPLALSIEAVSTTHSGRAVTAVEVLVHNETSATLTPHFIVNTGDTATGFWSDHAEATRVGPHRTASVTLYPPARTAAPQKGARWLVQAYTSNPPWLSTSSLTPYPLPHNPAWTVRHSRAR